MKIELSQVLRGPVITERSTQVRERANQYVFSVHPDATKGEIRRAVETLFKVDVLSVNTLRTHGKLRRMGRFQGHRPDMKKAYVHVKPGQTIQMVEEA